MAESHVKDLQRKLEDVQNVIGHLATLRGEDEMVKAACDLIGFAGTNLFDKKVEGFLAKEFRVKEGPSLSKDYTDLQSRIAELEAERGWIDVNEKLPEKPGAYFCAVQHRDQLGGRVDYHSVLVWESHSWVASVFDKVTHWMPIPPLPTTQEQSND
jgi:hypothetical protein